MIIGGRCQKIRQATAILFTESDGCIIHGIDDGQGFHPDALGAEGVTAALEALFNGGGYTGHFGTGLSAQIHQAVESLTVGQKIVHQQHLIPGEQVIPADHDGVVGIMGEGMDFGSVEEANVNPPSSTNRIFTI